MSDSTEPFGQSVLACVDDMSRLWPALRRRYDPAVGVSAVAEQVGASLRALLRRRMCDPGDARPLLERIERYAFYTQRDAGPPRGAAPSHGASPGQASPPPAAAGAHRG